MVFTGRELSVEEEAPTLALHFFEAQHREKAWLYCRMAGDRARAIAAHVEAARFYERALTTARPLRNVGDPDPPRWLHALLGTHPTAVERIGIAQRYAEASNADPHGESVPGLGHWNAMGHRVAARELTAAICGTLAGR